MSSPPCLCYSNNAVALWLAFELQFTPYLVFFLGILLCTHTSGVCLFCCCYCCCLLCPSHCTLLVPTRCSTSTFDFRYTCPPLFSFKLSSVLWPACWQWRSLPILSSGMSHSHYQNLLLIRCWPIGFLNEFPSLSLSVGQLLIIWRALEAHLQGALLIHLKYPLAVTLMSMWMSRKTEDHRCSSISPQNPDLRPWQAAKLPREQVRSAIPRKIDARNIETAIWNAINVRAKDKKLWKLQQHIMEK